METRMIGDEIYLDGIRVGSIDDTARGHGALLADVLRSGIEIASKDGGGAIYEHAVDDFSDELADAECSIERLTDAIRRALPLLAKNPGQARHLLESALE